MYSFLKNVYAKILKKIMNYPHNSAPIPKVASKFSSKLSFNKSNSDSDNLDCTFLRVYENESIITVPFNIPNKSSDCLR